MFRARPTALLALLLLWTVPRPVVAQVCEVSPFVGYRFGGDLYEFYLGRPLDADVAPAAGIVVDIFVDRATSVSFIYSRQHLDVPAWLPAQDCAESARLSVEHWLVGGAYELDGGRVRPFLSGGAGLTRFGSAHDAEYRFAAGGGGGVKLMPTRHLGFRLDGRVYAVFVDGNLGGTVCGGGGCFINLDVFVLWQVEFTAGLVFSF